MPGVRNPYALNHFSFRGHPFNRTNVKVRAVSGLFGLPPLRGSDFLTMNRTGQLFVPKVPDSRHITLEILVLNDGTGVAQDIFDELATLFANRAQGPLVFTPNDGTGDRTGQAECILWQPTNTPDRVGKVWSGIADFQLADPWLYGATVSLTGSLSSSPTFGKPAVSGPITTAQTTSYVVGPVSVVSGQPLVLVHAVVGAGADPTGFADTFSGHYTFTKIVMSGAALTMWIGTGGTGTSGSVTVSFASCSAGGILIPLGGCSTLAGAAAVDASASATGSTPPPFANVAATPTASFDVAVYAVEEYATGLADIAGWYPAGNLSYIGSPTVRANVLLAPPSGVSLSGTWPSTPGTGSGWRAEAMLVKGLAGSAVTTLTVVNPGIATAERVTIDVLGDMTNLYLTNTTTGESMSFLGHVAAGTHLVIDCGAYTALNDGTNAIGLLAHSGGTRWLTLAPGQNTLTAYASAVAGASLTVSFAPAFA